jgi:hypothetical protein
VIQFTDTNNQSETAESNACGGLAVCASDAGAIIALQATATGYIPTLYADIRAVQSEYYQQLPMFTPQIITDSTATLDPPLQIDAASVMVHVFSKDVADGGCQPAGWTFTLTDLDGGAISSGIGYLNGLSTFSATGPTSPQGIALFYNLDPTVTQITVHGTSTFPGCTYIGANYQYTGAAHVSPGRLTIMTYPIQ